ncbi:MAG: sensor histidine kinase, partial [Microvirga sp.]
ALADAEGGTVHVLDEASGRLELAAAHRLTGELARRVRDLPAYDEGTILGRCTARREPVQSEDVALDRDYALRELVLRAGFRSLLALPLVREGHVIGGLIVCRAAPGAFPPETVGLLQSFTAQSALAIHNAKLYQEIVAQRHALELASRHKSQFLANMSHELRTPLNAILGFAEVMQGGMFGALGSEKYTEYCRDIRSSGQYLLSVINDILDMSRIEAGRVRLAKRQISVEVALDKALKLVGERARSKALELSVDALPGATVPADERALQQILVNLLDNAVKFTPQGGRIAVRTRFAGDAINIYVEDSGIGIPRDALGKLGRPFEQVETEFSKTHKGSGLGLAIARSLSELHGGGLRIRSLPGLGTVVMVHLPRYAAIGTPERVETVH